jgi:DNA repair protein RecO (recombination protein O)
VAAGGKRVADEPAFVLHSYAWSESSLVVEAFCRHHGRIALVAKGAKKPSSGFRPVLLPLQPLRLTYGSLGGAGVEGDADIYTLKSAQWVGEHTLPAGEALLSGLYLNELLMRLLARGDPHVALFDAYAGAVRVLASEYGEVLEAVLRSFELLLLREIGLLPMLDVQTVTQDPILPGASYVLTQDRGLCRVSADDRTAIGGRTWLLLQAALTSMKPHAEVLKICVHVASSLKPQLRGLLQHHCGAPALRTRQFMMDVQNL